MLFFRSPTNYLCSTFLSFLQDFLEALGNFFLPVFSKTICLFVFLLWNPSDKLSLMVLLPGRSHWGRGGGGSKIFLREGFHFDHTMGKLGQLEPERLTDLPYPVGIIWIQISIFGKNWLIFPVFFCYFLVILSTHTTKMYILKNWYPIHIFRKNFCPTQNTLNYPQNNV